MIDICAGLRHRCEARGTLSAKEIHEANRWIAATAISLAVALVSNDGVFADVGLRVLSRS